MNTGNEILICMCHGPHQTKKKRKGKGGKKKVKTGIQATFINERHLLTQHASSQIVALRPVC